MTDTVTRPTPPRRRRGRIGLVVAAIVLALVGVALLVHGLDAPGAPPAPPPAASSAPATLDPVPAPTGAPAASPAPDDAAPVALPASPPTSISIPAIGVNSRINPLGLNPDRTLQVPAPGPTYDQAAWYRESVSPGQIGPSVILGHVDSARNGPSVFYRLGALRPGGAFSVTRADGSVLTFRIDSVRSYPKDAFPTETVYGGTTRPEVRLITCGGDFDRSARSYRDNTVVFAHLLAP